MHQKLFMLLLGGRPKGRNTEQHDVCFAIGQTLKETIPAIKKFWREAAANVHIDAWKEISWVDGYNIMVREKSTDASPAVAQRPTYLFFINLGGYKENEFEEFHYKLLVAAPDPDAAKMQARKTAFYKHTGITNGLNTHSAVAHIDDKYGIDVDDIFNVADIIPEEIRQTYSIELLPSPGGKDDAMHLGYFKLSEL